MKITREEDYAITIVSALVNHYQNGFLPLSAVARRYGLPEPFLKKIARRLKAAGLVAVKEGREGGYRLAKSPRSLSLGAVLSAFNPQPLLTPCLLADHRGKCEHFEKCASKQAWHRISRGLYEHFNHIPFGDFISLNSK